MSNSSLVNVTVWCAEGNYTHGRSGRNIEMVALHHMAGVLSAEECGRIFQQAGRGASANYGIGKDGEVGLYVDEYNTAWANANWDSNCKSVSIELSNSSASGNYPVSDVVLNKAIDLIADIFKRNNLGKCVKGQNLVWHSMYSNTYCPGDYIRGKLDYIVDKVNEKLGLNSNAGSNDNLYKVQAGAFSKKENAENLAKEIKNKGIDTCIITEDGLYKVQCGAFKNVDNAKNIAKTLNNMGYDTYIVGLNESTSSNQSSNTIKAGDKVRVTNAVQYNGQSFAVYFDTYDVIEVSGDRAVIGQGSEVTCAININNITKV
ncbi:MAG TPA: N-acetylmuramoyl-L-alanine amidase [Candidatus Onthocola stercoravium]|nr:N-acetylmuramoyl-L-alanine amidase [Candidatus Onthocola stercoravium]